jgi:hypothetical protein
MVEEDAHVNIRNRVDIGPRDHDHGGRSRNYEYRRRTDVDVDLDPRGGLFGPSKGEKNPHKKGQ